MLPRLVSVRASDQLLPGVAVMPAAGRAQARPVAAAGRVEAVHGEGGCRQECAQLGGASVEATRF